MVLFLGDSFGVRASRYFKYIVLNLFIITVLLPQSEVLFSLKMMDDRLPKTISINFLLAYEPPRWVKRK